MRRVQPDEVAAYGSLEKYLHKPNPAAGEQWLHESAMLWQNNWGASGDISLWNDFVDVSPEHSILQLWVQRGGAGDQQSIEAGWVRRVNQNAKLFLFVTTNGYASGCWNADCGFIHTNASIPLDVSWSAYSAVDGSQYDNVFFIFKDYGNGSWWFNLEGQWVGYWPRSMFDAAGLEDHGDYLAMGGEVYDQPNGRRTRTDMGSGHWPSEGFQKSAYIRDMRWMNTSLAWQQLSNPVLQDEGDPPGSEKCYDISKQSAVGSGWEHYIFVGGAGRNSKCCIANADCSAGTTCQADGTCL